MAISPRLVSQIAIAASLALAASPALAQQAINNQLQWGDVFANMNVVTTGQTGGVTSAATAAGNTASAANMAGGVNFSSRQTMSGATSATATIQADTPCCYSVAAASAQHNALQAQTAGGDLTLDGGQIADGGDVSALAHVGITSTQSLTAAAGANANNIATAADHGGLNATIAQTSLVSVNAFADTDACCSGQTVIGAQAAANAWSSTSTTSTVIADVNQASRGAQVYASADAAQQQAYDVTAAANAAGNSISLANQFGFTQLRGTQDNDTAIKSEARVTLATWNPAYTATSSANAAGNTVLATNVGSDLLVDLNQVNTGGVDAFASLAGGAGGAAGAGILTSTAVGNGFTGYVCAQCSPGSAGGVINQTSGGAVTATGSITTTGSGAVVGSASAVGNSASFITVKPN